MNILKYMGNTPIVQVEHPNGTRFGRVFVKLEEFNPGGSVKARVALQMIEDAEAAGRLKLGNELIEPTGGNTGIGLAIAASLKGYRLTLVVPNIFSKEKIATLRSLGADVVLSDHNKLGNNSHIIVANEMLAADNRFICLDQFSNPSNPKAHYLGTGPEFLRQLDRIDCFVAGIGSGGTIAGVGRRLRETGWATRIVGVQPEGCDVLHGKFIPHKIQGISVGVISKFFQLDEIDEIVSISYSEVDELRSYLGKRQGLFVGLSAGANIAAALRMARRYDSASIIATVAPDSGRSYIENEDGDHA